MRYFFRRLFIITSSNRIIQEALKDLLRITPSILMKKRRLNCPMLISQERQGNLSIKWKEHNQFITLKILEGIRKQTLRRNVRISRCYWLKRILILITLGSHRVNKHYYRFRIEVREIQETSLQQNQRDIRLQRIRMISQKYSQRGNSFQREEGIAEE